MSSVARDANCDYAMIVRLLRIMKHFARIAEEK
jgi:hypothetical protein